MSKDDPLKSYHLAWLSVHVDRTEQWLREKLKEGFQIHHVDGVHSNDSPDNLALMEGLDHMALHGMPLRKACEKRARNNDQPKFVKIRKSEKLEKLIKLRQVALAKQEAKSNARRSQAGSGPEARINQRANGFASARDSSRTGRYCF